MLARLGLVAFALGIAASASYVSSSSVATSRPSLLASIGLHRVPPYAQMNVSQEEFELKFHEYEKRLNDGAPIEERIQLYHFHHPDDRPRRIVDFDWARNESVAERAENARIRVLVEASGSGDAELEFAGRGRLREKRSVQSLPRWVELDAGTTWWTAKLACRRCRITRAAVYVVTGSGRQRRSPPSCRGGESRCCRHPMNVVFSELPGYEFILQPFGFDAGFCRGSCPHKYNPANHHASLQSLIWQLKKADAPRPCCAPKRLRPLQLLHLSADDPTKLEVTTWSNIKVTECACF